jgi:hypothetical protein
MLKGVEAEVGEAGDIVSRRVDAEDAALVAGSLAFCIEPLSSGQKGAFSSLFER